MGKYLKIKVELANQIDKIQFKLDSVKEAMRKYREDIEAIRDASNSLSDKKFALASTLKKTIDVENSLDESNRILQRNRLALRSRKAQLIKQMLLLNEDTQKFTAQNVKVVRCDCSHPHIRNKHRSKNKNRDGIHGTLSCSKGSLEFISALHEDRIFNVKHELIDVDHSTLNNFSSTTQSPLLLVFLNPEVPYHGGHSIHHHGQDLKGVITAGYQFKLQQISGKDTMLLIHHFITTKRDLLDKVASVNFGRSVVEEKGGAEVEMETEEAIEKNGHAPARNVISIKEIEITDELIMNVLNGDQLRQIIARCPARVQCWRWNLFYSTALHGISMNTLYSRCANAEESILIISTNTNDIFGAFVDCAWTVCSEYRGSVDCFVFQFVNTSAVETNGDAESAANGVSKIQFPQRLKVYKASGKVPYFMRNDMESVTIGAGENPAIYFDADLNFGRSTASETFSSPQLSQDSPFQITTLEIWAPSL